MNNVVFKRIGAYLVDLVFIVMLVTMLSQIRFLNPNVDKYYDKSTEYLQMIEETDDLQKLQQSDEYKNITYDMVKLSYTNTIIEIVCYISYFGLFQFWNKGQTLGKKIFKLKVVDNKTGKEAKWYKLLIRTIVLYSVYASVILLILLFALNKNAYIISNEIVSTISSVAFYTSALFVILKSDSRGLHDMISGTRVDKE